MQTRRKVYRHLHHFGPDALQVERIIYNWLARQVNPLSPAILQQIPATLPPRPVSNLAQEEAVQGYSLGPELLHLLQPFTCSCKLRGHYAIPMTLLLLC